MKTTIERRRPLVQEGFVPEPWPRIAVTLLMKVTHGDQVRPVAYELLGEYPTPAAYLESDPERVRDILRPLGLQSKREGELRRLAELLSEEPRPTREQIEALPGVGAYVGDAYSLLVLDEYVDPDDYALRIYAQAEFDEQVRC